MPFSLFPLFFRFFFFNLRKGNLFILFCFLSETWSWQTVIADAGRETSHGWCWSQNQSPAEIAISTCPSCCSRAEESYLWETAACSFIHHRAETAGGKILQTCWFYKGGKSLALLKSMEVFPPYFKVHWSVYSSFLLLPLTMASLLIR